MTTKTKRKTKQIQTKFVRTEEYELHGGDVLLYRGSRSGKNWQFRMWISEDKKYFRQSLRTKDKDIAIERSTELYLETHHKMKSGMKIFDTTVRELVNDYLQEQKKEYVLVVLVKGI